MGEPNNALMEELAKTEADRVAKQRELLGDAGLTEKATILERATQENEVIVCKKKTIENFSLDNIFIFESKVRSYMIVIWLKLYF